MYRLSIPFASIVALLAALSGASALEYPIGEPRLMNGMEIAAVYLQPIEMEPAHIMKPAPDSDIHLEADIHATQDNNNGFAEGDWIPNLTIEYTLTKLDGDGQTGGIFMPMVASDGPHYGDNVKLMGPGRYRLVYKIASEAFGAASHFGRHVDKETGVGVWPGTFTVEYEFTYAGTGKKSSY
jgi:periplasmic iron binding protein